MKCKSIRDGIGTNLENITTLSVYKFELYITAIVGVMSATNTISQ